MAVSKNLTIVFMFFYSAVILYLILLFYIPYFRDLIISIRQNLSYLTEGANYIWALLISFGICLLGSASILLPIPFPFVLFTLSNSVYLKYLNNGYSLSQIVQTFPFWLEILGLAVIGGLGSAIGEFTGYMVGFGAKKIVQEAKSPVTENIDGFRRLILKNKKFTPIYIFLFALTPLPDDILFLPLGMIKYPFWKSIIPGWSGKSVTTIFYCLWPIFIAYGFMVGGTEVDHISSIITEAILLLVTITIMFFIMSFNWNKYLVNRIKKRQNLK